MNRPNRHTRALPGQQRRQIGASLALSAAVLGVGAALLAWCTLRVEPAAVAFHGFWVEEPQKAAAAHGKPAAPAELLLVEAPQWEGLPVQVEPPPPAWAEPPLLPEVEPLPAPPAEEPDLAEFPTPRRIAARRPQAIAPPASVAEHTADYTPPAYLQTPKPPYPAGMRQSGIEGRVKLRVALDAEGLPQQVDVVQGSGHAEFDSSAQLWVLRHWRFKPARRGEQAVPATVVTQVHFVLR